MRPKTLVAIVFFMLALYSCMGTEYFDVASAELESPEETAGIIPQEGTTLTLNLDYKFDYYTKFRPGEARKPYRYLVLIDGWEYCYGVTVTWGTVSIPIMANDTHKPAFVVVLGSKAWEYEESTTDWDSYHELYSGTQECLPATETPRYAYLKDKYLQVKLDGRVFRFSLRDSGACQVLKRILADGPFSVPAEYGYYLRPNGENEISTRLWKSIPPSDGSLTRYLKAGEIYLDASNEPLICLKDKEIGIGITIIGSVFPEDMDALKALFPGRNRYKEATMTLSLQ